MIRVVNLTICAKLNCRVSLRKIAIKCNNVEYKDMKFKCVIMRIRNPRSTCLIFESGNLVVTGCHSYKSGRVAVRKFARIIQKIGYAVHLTDINVKNMVGTIDCGFAINLQKLYDVINPEPVQTDSSLRTIKTSHNQEMFPSKITYKAGKCKINVFYTGKLVITGARKRTELNDAFDELFSLLLLTLPKEEEEKKQLKDAFDNDDNELFSQLYLTLPKEETGRIKAEFDELYSYLLSTL